MCNQELVDDVLSLRNQLKRTERSLQVLGEQLSQSQNDSIDCTKNKCSLESFPLHVTFQDNLHKPDAVKATSYSGRLARSSTPKPEEQKLSARLHSSDCGPRSDREMENEAAQLRRKLNSVREENSSLMLENRQLISDLEAAQLEIASSKSKMRVLGSTIGAKTSSVSIMKEQILDLEAQLEAQAKVLREADLKRAASEQTALQCTKAAEKHYEELKVAKTELGEKTRQWKRVEHQRNQALQNAEKLTMSFENYKDNVAKKLKKVMENEGKLKASLIECDREKEELERRCTELEREKERMSHSRSMELKEAQVHAEALSAERQALQARVQQTTEQLGYLQRELELKETQLQENQDGALCANPCFLPSVTDNLHHKPGEQYQKLLAALQSVEKEKSRQVSAAKSLQERLSRAQEEISSLQASITQRASHYQQLHNQLLEKASQATTLEKEEKDSSIHHYQSLLKKRKREHQKALETSKMAETHRCRELEDRIEVRQAEVTELNQIISSIQSEKQEVEHQSGLLQESVDRLKQEMNMKDRQSEEEIHAFEEQAFQTASKIRALESELSLSKEELGNGLQQVQQVKKQYEKQLKLKNSELSVLQEALTSRALAFESSTEENLQLQRSIQRQHTMLQDSTSRIAQLEDSQGLLQSQVSQLEQELEKERINSSHQLREKQVEVEEAEQEVQKKEKQATELSASITQLSAEMNACREELTAMETELLHLRRDSSAKALQLNQMQESMQETRGMLEKKSEAVLDLEEKLHQSETDRRNSLQRAQLLEEQLKTVRSELTGTLGHLEDLRDVLQRTQLTNDQQQATIKQLTTELRESQQELEERNHEVLDMDTALKERQGELQQRAELLGQLDMVIKEHKLEMDRKVEHLQDVLKKTEKKLNERDKQNVLELGQQLRVCREQLQKSAQDLRDAHAHCDALSGQLEDVTQQEKLKKLRLQGEAQLQSTVTELQRDLEQQREEHNRELSALQQTRGQLLKVSEQISGSLRSSHEQLEEAKANAAELHAQLHTTQQLLEHANETLLVKESEIARLQAKISSLDRASTLNSTLHQESSAFSPPLKSTVPSFPPSGKEPLARSSISSTTSWQESSSDVSLELSESLKASVKATLKPPSSPRSSWQGLNHTELSSNSDMTFNPLTYMLDGEEPEEPEMNSLSGMLRFVNQTLAMQEQHADTHFQGSTHSKAS
ncbi:Coiled-coil domain-containing protein 18 [Bagarius yarrelli]|uniref:Coiled-coil domain-containing protein 18 n=1 Tax=Bagarius yarrelli TaxID=175774 RepID=A0A556V3L9_BAGYA|nr:Coiled-coil domain-containing protein 18 [Bagarius yarrelli]